MSSGREESEWVILARGPRLRNNPDMVIREFRESDRDACRACIVELQDSERKIDPRLRNGDEISDAYFAQILERCRKYSGTILLAEFDGDVAGLAVILCDVPFEQLDEPPGRYAIVADLVVREEFRRRGIARELLHEAERIAVNASAPELRIGVLSNNDAARKLYLDEGFRPYLETLSKPLI